MFELSDKCVHESFAARAAEAPEALAVSWSGGCLTYGELNARANQLARHLQSLGVGPEVPVGILARRSPEMLVGILATLKAGGCYLPLDPAYPEERLAETLADAGARLLLSASGLATPRIAGSVPAVFRLDEDRESLSGLSEDELEPLAGPDNLAYVIYTSGSTGKPKGVEVEHRGLSNLVSWHVRTYQVTPADRATRLAGSAFDASVWEVWPYLAAGASLHIPPDELLLSPPDLISYLIRERITLCFLPTPLAEAALDEAWPREAPLRAVLTGGDRLHRAPGPEHPFRFYNHYGPTENSVVATACPVPPGNLDSPPPIGRPIDGVEARLEEGELWIGGVGLARGYRGRPDLTAERFVPHPASATPGARMYRTGDLVRELPSGDLDFVGRIDFQVKVRGFRIELGEIEVSLHRHPDVKEGVVEARDDGRGGKRLVAYVVSRGTFDPAELAEFLSRTLPEYMVPTAWVEMESLPLTPNGKVDRRALPEPERDDQSYVAPRTEREEALAAIFAEVLGLSRVGIGESFFALGGHSLQATQVVSRVRSRLGLELAPGVIFENPTVAELASVMTTGDEGTKELAIQPLERVGDEYELPASFVQQGLWLSERWSPEPALYNTPFALELAGPLDVPALARALQGIVDRHEPLRARFREVDGEPVQVVSRRLFMPLPVLDLSALPEDLAAAEAERISAEEARRPFDLARGPVLRVLLVRRSPSEHRLLLLMHHIVADDWSLTVMMRELAALYQGASLPPLPVQYGDFAAWQRRWLSGAVLERQLGWWRETLRPPLPVLDLPADRPRPAQRSFRGARLRTLIPREHVEALAAVGQRGESWLFMPLLAALDVLLYRYTGNSDVLVGSPIANRNRVELEGMAGFFVNTLALRGEVDGDAGFLDLLDRTRRTLLGAYEHQDLPFERLVEELAPERDLSRNPLVDVFFILGNALQLPDRLGPELALEVRELEVGVAKIDLSLFLDERPEGLSIVWEYATDLFDRTTVERMAGHLENLVAGLGAEPERPVLDILLLSSAERAQLAAWNEETRRERPTGLVGSTLHGLFEAQARRTPEATALIAGEERLTYAVLEERAEALARSLRGLGVGPEVGVGIFLEREAGLIVALLATLKAGGFYVPLDPAYPAERVGFMLEDSRCAVVLTDTDLHGRLHGRARTVLLDEELPAGPAAGLAAGSGNLAYVIYTSGSTGRPKAVAIEHRSAVAMVLWSRREFSDLELSGVLASTSITFDMSVFEIFAPLAWGGTVILAENALALPHLPAAREVRVVDTVPSAMAELIRMGGVPDSVVTVNLGGEAVPRSLADRVYALPGVERLYNVYGPSEDTTFSTWALIDRTERAPSIGRPLDGEQAWVVDRRLQPVPVGVPGELYMGGEGVTRGYLGRPDLTAERFLPDPFSSQPGARMYRVGDLVRYRPDGEMEFLGRIDHQVKIRGFRVELGEIEDALNRLPGVKAAAVLARDGGLAAYVVPRLDVTILRDGLRERLPDYMVPTAFAFLDALPLTPNGKVDRRALARLPFETEAAGEDYVAPRNPVEEMVAAIFAEVLGLERVGVHDDFFELGGHSLLATRVISRLRGAFAVEPEMRVVFERSTVEALAAWVALARRGDVPQAPPIVPRDSEAPAPLSFAQERLWFLRQLEPESIAYNLPMIFRIGGPLKPAALEAALAEVERRHEVLRTVFSDGVQVVLPPGRKLPLVDLSGVPAEEADRLALAEARRPFDLERGPVLRTTLLRLGPEEHRLLLTLDHAAADAWSVEILVRELGALYSDRLSGISWSLPEPRLQYADYAAWQRGWLAGDVLAAELSHWRERLAGAPLVLELPTDLPRPPVQSHRGGVEWVRIDAGLTEEIRRLARRSAATPFMVLLGAFQALMGRYARQEELLVGSPVAGRTRGETEGLIGLFVNTLVLRGDLTGDPAFADLLARLRETSLAAYAHQDLPFETLVEGLAPERDLSRTPIFQVLFGLQNTAPLARELAPGLSLKVEEGLTEQAKFDLKLMLDDDGVSLTGGWEYCADLFEAATVRRLAGHFTALLAGLVADPQARLWEIPFLGEEERRQVLLHGVTGADGGLVHERFERWATRTPEAPALAYEGTVLTFREVDEQANRLARRLRRLGVGPETPVGVRLERSPGMVVAILGVLKAGGAYVPLDPEFPEDRLAFMLEDSGARVLVTEEFLDSLGDESAAPLEPLAGPEHLAYVIYTSGSTGRPKGVMVEHRQLSSYVDGVLARMALPDGSSYATVSTIAADLGNTVVFASLVTGGLLHVISRDRLGDSLRLAEYFERHPIDALKIVPSHLAALERVVPRRLLVTGGEALPWTLADRIRETAPECRVLNHYGPTETTVGVLAFPVEPDAERYGPTVPLGRPLGGTRVAVVDERLQPVPLGVPGELLAGGPQVTRGYLGRPDLTAERFVPDPFGDGARLYRTGDLARLLMSGDGGDVEFLGRIDHQVKIRGFRVELGEIEAALRSHPDVREALVLARPLPATGENRLVAYVVPRNPGTADGLAAELRRRSRETLPEALVPSAFVLLEAIPLTPNGKVDRRALPEPEAVAAVEAGALASLSPVEAVVAGVFAQLLGLDRVEADDDFFALGGHSLLAMRVLAQLRKAFDADLDLRVIFEGRTVSGLARRIEERLDKKILADAPPLAPQGRFQEGMPLSFAQESLWLLDRLEPGAITYNVPRVVRLWGEPSVPALAAALNGMVQRHEVLRTVYGEIHGEPRQRVLPFEEEPLPVVDLSGLPETLRRAESERLTEQEARRPVDLATGPILRALLLRISPADHALLVLTHHIASDGWSVGVMVRELSALYKGEPLSPLPLQYADFAAWQRSWLAGSTLGAQVDWWRRELSGGTALDTLPMDRPRPRPQPSTSRGALERFSLPPSLAGELERLGQRHGATLFMTLLAGFQALLHRYTGEEDLRVGTSVSGRGRAEVADLIGFFVNTLVLRGDLSGRPSFTELLARVRESALGAYAHQDLPFVKLVEALAPERSQGGATPLFQALFALERPTAAPVFEIAPGLAASLEEPPVSTAKFDLTVVMEPAGESLAGSAEYSTDLFDAATVRRLLGHFETLLASLAADPGGAVSEAPLLGEEERRQLIVEWNGTETTGASPLEGIEERIARWATLIPNAPAVFMDGHSWTHAELEARTAAISRHLRRLGVGPETVVGVLLDRSPEAVATLLGVLRAGGAYLPLDPAYPSERLAYMLSDSGASLLVTRRSLWPALPSAGVPVLELENVAWADHGETGANGSDPGNLAYVLYTSGSTGRPKGVGVPRASLASRADAMARLYELVPGDRVLQFASLSFDVAAEEIFPTLASGAAVVLATDPRRMAAADLGALVEREGITVLNLPSPVWHEWVDALPEALPASLRLMVVGSDAVSAERLARWRKTGLPTFNAYGLTETTVTATASRIEGEEGPRVPIGRPVAGARAYVVDPHGQLVPLLVPGELWIGGAGLARGYLSHPGRPDLTAERFLPDPFTSEPGARLYRTGDLVRRRSDGVLEFLGRIDSQMKVRGFRIEPGEVEAPLAGHPGIAQAAVGVREDRLVAYVVAREGWTPDPNGLRSFLEERLAAHMVPSLFAFLEALPRTPSGKVDRRALAQSSLPKPAEIREAGTEPQTPAEFLLAELFAGVLGLEQVEPGDNFFHLGGHSLLAARLVAQVREAFGIELPLRVVFDTPTVAALARWIEEARGALESPEEPEPPIETGPRTLPTSFAQQRLWLLDRLQNGASAMYNMPSELRLHGPLRPEALAAALNEVVRRHEVLRTVFAVEDGHPLQVVQPFASQSLPLVDLTALPELWRLEETARLEAEWSRRPFDLERGPVFRASLLRLGNPENTEHRLLLNVHHIASDGWSNGVLTQELGELYQAFAAGLPSPLPELPMQYGDYAAWQRRRLSGDVLEEQLAFWRGRLGMDPEPLELPADRPRPAVQSGRGAVASRSLTADFGSRLERLARNQGATSFMAFLASFQALLHRYTGREDLTVGTPVAGRDRVEVEGLVGCFVNTLALRTDVSGDPSFLELLERVQETALSAFIHQDLPFERLVEELVSGRDLSRTPICQVAFILQHETTAVPAFGPELRVELERSHHDTAKFDLALFFGRSESATELMAEYSTDLFEAGTVERLLGHLGVLIEGAEEDPGLRLSELPLLEPAERAQLLAWNEETRRERPEELVGSTLHGLFEAQARRTPEATALVVGTERLSYATLEERSEALARHLRALGVGPEVGVGIFLEREAGLVVALLATLKAGGFYVPLDPAYPAERVGFMLEDSHCAVVLTDTDLHGRLHGQARTVLIDQELQELPAGPAGVGVPAGSGNLAYLIYTSGSTGRPKAVAIEHRSAVAMVLWSRREFSDLELSGVLASTSITFDMSVFEIFAPLAWGGTVILAENALALPQLPARNEVRVIDTVPSAMAELIRMDGVPSSVVTVNLGGEAIPRMLADQVYGVPGIERLYNVYGPSEDTTFSTWALVDRTERAPSIGRPLDGEQAWVVDRHMNLTPVGVPGELFMGGEGVSRGYFGRPDLTAERFVPDPFSEVPGSRMYRVGDLVRYRPDGELEFLGRIDHQVKIRGFRVELGEVEEALLRLPGVEAAVVLARDNTLAAYVVPRLEMTAGALREGLRQRLPEYMVPTTFVFLEALPLTPNGKVDRRALATISMETGQPEAEAYDAPRGPVEEVVAEAAASLLELDRIGREDDFFELGGHSLLAARLVARIRELFGVDLSLRAVFETPTVEGLAQRIEVGRASASPRQMPSLLAQARQEAAPASFAQQRLWLIDRLRRDSDSSAAYNMSSVFRVRGPLRPEVLGAALDEIVRRHEVLRTVFGMEDGQPVQIVQPFEPRGLPVLDLEAGGDVDALLRNWSLQPFDLERGPVFRSTLLRLSGDEHLLLLNVHHIASDGWSNGILVRELGALYRAFAAGLPSPLPPLPVQYADYAVWQRGWLTGEVLEEQLGFWRSHLGVDPEPLELPADRPRPAVQSGRGGTVRHHLAMGLGDRLEQLAQSRGATPFMAWLAAFQALLHRYTGRRDLSVGTPVANRDQLDVEGLIGCFVNTLVLHTDLSGDPPFLELLERARDTALEAFHHQDLPFERLVEELVPGRDLSRAPLAQVVFVLQQGADTALELGPELRVKPEASHAGTAKFDLTLFAGRSDHGMELLAEYSTDLFEVATVERLLGHLGVLVAGIEENPEARLSELPLLERAERAQLLAWNEETRRERPEELVGSTLHGLFEAQARRTPEATALVVGTERLSYATLEERSEALARHLRALGVGPEVGVGIFLEREVGLVVALLATLKAGGFYVPLDPAYPAERVGFMLEDSLCAVVLTDTDLHGRLHGRARTVLIDQELPAGPAGVGVPAGSGNLAYLIYTSGSTGRPKAVAIEHRSAVAMVLWSRREFSDLELSGVLASTSITFDMSVFEIFAPLAWGGTVILAENALALPQLPARNEVRVVDTVPSAMAELIRMDGVPPSVVTVNLGGEAIPRMLADQVYGVPGIERLYNVYGPSEDTTFSTWALVDRTERAPSIGRPLDGEQAWVVDRHMNLTPVGVPGELFIGGEGVSRGYFGRPDLTAERFVPDPFSEVPGSRMYRVGDLVRYRPDGELEFLGRIDHQVKIRGFRVELGEVEEALLRLPGVEAAVVLARDNTLAAYVVPRLEMTAGPLREGLRQRLPEYMVPTAFVFLEALPLTPNGKVDRRALATVSIETGQPEAEAYVAPRSPLERMVAEVFANLLGLERVGVDGDFFELGGHSLLAARLVARIRELFGTELSLRAVFEMPTVESLARWIEESFAVQASAKAPLLKAQPRRDSADTAPASFAQQRLWFIDRLRHGSSAYNMPSVFRVHGPLRPEVLSKALNEIVHRHEVLRTVYAVEDGQPVQVVQPFLPWTLTVVEMEAGTEARHLAKEWSLQPFDLERGPIFRALLLRLSDREHLLLLNVHHIASDGWSTGLMVQELGALYQAFAAGVPSPLPPLPVQYADYAVWQRGWLTGEVLEEQIAFWRSRLGVDPEPLELPSDRPRPAVQSGRGAVERHHLPAGMGGRMERLAQARGATPFMAYLATFQTLLHRYTGRDVLSVGTPVANRGLVEVEGLIGCFVNTLVLRTDLSGDPTFPQLLERVRETSLSAFEHQELPFERLVEELVPGRDLSRTPLAQVAFALQQEAAAAPAFGPELRVEVEPGHSDTAKFDLALFLGRFGDTVNLLAEYSTDLFESATVRRLLGHLEALVAGIEEHPMARLSELPLLGEAERAQLLAWNEETRRERPEELVGSTLHGLFEAQARRTPDATALVVGEDRLSYAFLEKRAEALARSLRGLGVGPEVGVGIFLRRGAELVVSLLATLKAGGFYVPLDPAYPAERVEFMLEDSRCAVVLTDTDLHGRLHGRARTVLIDQELQELPAAPPAPATPAGSGNLAYLIYTSGSTGRPKAVAIEHRSAVAMVLWSRREFSDFELSGVLASTSITFDMSVFEIFAPLAWGGTVILAENALALPHLPARSEVRVVDTVPSAMAELIRMNGVPSSVVTVNLGGEAVPRALADRVYGVPGIERLYNVYGPSEDTTFSTWALIDRTERAPSIGRPLDGEQAWVVDRHLNPTPVGVPGELYLGGEGVSRGYFGRPDLTAERFIPDPFSGIRGVPGSRMYRVGDLVRYRPDGELEFLGRIDHQVKIRGFRVELGEVEEALLRLPGVEAAVVLARDSALAAYVVPRLEMAPLREGLRQRLPDYMVPTAFVFLDTLPLTPNGKVDRRALAKLSLEATPREDDGFVAPRNPVEEQMAEIWADVLGVEKVGIHDTFWDLGGHSLLATRVLSRLYESLGVELPLQTLFEYPTVAELSEAVGQTLLTAGGEEVDQFLAELEGLSEDELQELLRQESL